MEATLWRAGCMLFAGLSAGAIVGGLAYLLLRLMLSDCESAPESSLTTPLPKIDRTNEMPGSCGSMLGESERRLAMDAWRMA